MNLIEEIRNGNKEAVKQIYQENAQDVYNFAKGITSDHDTAMTATKAAFSKLFKQIQGGFEPANIHSAVLKLAYDEACKIAMPSVENVRSPYDEPSDQEDKAAENTQTEDEYENEAEDQESYDDYQEDVYERPAQRTSANSDPRSRRPVRNERYDDRRYNERYDDRDDYDDRRSPRSRYEDDYYDEYNDYDDKPKRGAGFFICLIINIILVLLLIWFLIGLLINLSILPDTLDLGYTWFNNTIYPLF